MLEKIECLSNKFRNAIDRAQKEGEFSDDVYMQRFTWGCCGNVSYLLAEYLLSYDIHTIWYSSCRDGYSHAWLIIKDNCVKPPVSSVTDLPDDIADVMSRYAGKRIDNELRNERYEESCFINSTLVDITGDQFEDYDKTVYVGPFDIFHKSFEFREAVDFNGLNYLDSTTQKCFYERYNRIVQYI